MLYPTGLLVPSGMKKANRLLPGAFPFRVGGIYQLIEGESAGRKARDTYTLRMRKYVQTSIRTK